NIDLLRLNRLALQRLRRVRARLAKHHLSIAFGLKSLLNLRSDNLPKSQQQVLERYRAQAQHDARVLMGTLADHIRATSRSELLDQEQKPSAEYRKYLKRQRAVTPDYVGDGGTTKRQHGKNRKRKK